MGKVMFYHLTRSGAEETARSLIARAMGQGWRVMLRSPDAAHLQRLDERFWLHPDDEFLPHGLQGGAQDADQPLLLGAGAITNAARALLLLDCAEASEAELAQLERVWILFDAGDPSQLGHARAAWKRLAGLGVAAEYWSEEGGRWEKKA